MGKESRPERGGGGPAGRSPMTRGGMRRPPCLSEGPKARQRQPWRGKRGRGAADGEERWRSRQGDEQSAVPWHTVPTRAVGRSSHCRARRACGRVSCATGGMTATAGVAAGGATPGGGRDARPRRPLRWAGWAEEEARRGSRCAPPPSLPPPPVLAGGMMERKRVRTGPRRGRHAGRTGEGCGRQEAGGSRPRTGRPGGTAAAAGGAVRLALTVAARAPSRSTPPVRMRRSEPRGGVLRGPTAVRRQVGTDGRERIRRGERRSNSMSSTAVFIVCPISGA